MALNVSLSSLWTVDLHTKDLLYPVATPAVCAPSSGLCLQGGSPDRWIHRGYRALGQQRQLWLPEAHTADPCEVLGKESSGKVGNGWCHKHWRESQRDGKSGACDGWRTNSDKLQML